MEHSSLTLEDSTLGGVGLRSDYSGPAARLTAESCRISSLGLDGPSAAGAVIRSSEVGTFIFANYGVSWGPASAPELVFDAVSVGPGSMGAWPGLSVHAGVSGARIGGSVGIDPSVWIYQWAPGSTVIRSFPVLVKCSDGTAAANVLVTVTDSSGTVLWGGTVGADGYAYPEITFGDGNFSASYTVRAGAGAGSAEAPLGFLSSTPIELVVPSEVLYLRGTGATANPATLYLDPTAPTGVTARYKDSRSVKYSGGNPWKEIGTWVRETGLVTTTADALMPLHVWLGLKNSDDIGTSFDLRAELYQNGSLVAAGEARAIAGITRNPSLAKEVGVAFDPSLPVSIGAGDALSVKVLTRIGTNPDGSKAPGHSSAAGLRLYFDSANRASRFRLWCQSE